MIDFFYHCAGLGRREMFQLAKSAVKFIFANGRVKEDLKEIFDLAEKKLDLWLMVVCMGMAW